MRNIIHRISVFFHALNQASIRKGRFCREVREFTLKGRADKVRKIKEMAEKMYGNSFREELYQIEVDTFINRS